MSDEVYEVVTLLALEIRRLGDSFNIHQNQTSSLQIVFGPEVDRFEHFSFPEREYLYPLSWSSSPGHWSLRSFDSTFSRLAKAPIIQDISSLFFGPDTIHRRDPFTLSLEVDRTAFYKGQDFTIFDTYQTALVATVLSVRDTEIYIAYLQYAHTWNEWIPKTSSRIVPFVPSFARRGFFAMMASETELPNLGSFKNLTCLHIDSMNLALPDTRAPLTQLKQLTLCNCMELAPCAYLPTWSPNLVSLTIAYHTYASCCYHCGCLDRRMWVPHLSLWKRLTHVRLYMPLTAHGLEAVQKHLAAMPLVHLTWFIYPYLPTPSLEHVLGAVMALQHIVEVHIRMIGSFGVEVLRCLKEKQEAMPSIWLTRVLQNYSYTDEKVICRYCLPRNKR